MYLKVNKKHILENARLRVTGCDRLVTGLQKMCHRKKQGNMRVSVDGVSGMKGMTGFFHSRMCARIFLSIFFIFFLSFLTLKKYKKEKKLGNMRV